MSPTLLIPEGVLILPDWNDKTKNWMNPDCCVVCYAHFYHHGAGEVICGSCWDWAHFQIKRLLLRANPEVWRKKRAEENYWYWLDDRDRPRMEDE